MNRGKIFSVGILKENPSLVMFLGMCPALAITVSLDNAFGMGAAVIAVLLFSNIIISLIRKSVPNEIRIPVYIIIIATLVSIIQMLMQAYMPSIYVSLGIFIPLIVVNCIILGRAEAFASKNTIVDSVLDALGMGLGFTLALVLISLIRQVVGTGYLSFHNPFDPTQVIFNWKIMSSEFVIDLFTKPAGAFLTFGLLIGLINSITMLVNKFKFKPKKVEAK